MVELVYGYYIGQARILIKTNAPKELIVQQLIMNMLLLEENRVLNPEDEYNILRSAGDWVVDLGIQCGAPGSGCDYTIIGEDCMPECRDDMDYDDESDIE